MKHETFNSIIAGLGLVLAAVTAWNQFSSKADELQVVSEGRTETGNQIEINKFGILDSETGRPAPTIGPTSWRVRIHNETDRPVSIVNFEFFLLGPEYERIMYSEAKEKLSSAEAGLPSIDLPINIPAHQTTAYVISAFIPFDRNVFEEEADCFDSEPTLHQAEECVCGAPRKIYLAMKLLYLVAISHSII